VQHTSIKGITQKIKKLTYRVDRRSLELEMSENKYITEAMSGINGVRALYTSWEESSYLSALSLRGVLQEGSRKE